MDDSGAEGGSKLMMKVKENPAVPVGLLGLAGIVAYRLYNVKSRTKKLSLYLIELRLIAQGTLMTCIIGGVGYKIYKDWVTPQEGVRFQPPLNKTLSS